MHAFACSYGTKLPQQVWSFCANHCKPRVRNKRDIFGPDFHLRMRVFSYRQDGKQLPDRWMIGISEESVQPAVGIKLLAKIKRYALMHLDE